MDYIIIYDITENALRTKVSDTLKDFGLERIQYSVFSGSITDHNLDNLVRLLEEFLLKGIVTDSIVIVPVCRACQDKVQELGSKKDMFYYYRPLVFA